MKSCFFSQFPCGQQVFSEALPNEPCVLPVCWKDGMLSLIPWPQGALCAHFSTGVCGDGWQLSRFLTESLKILCVPNTLDRHLLIRKSCVSMLLKWWSAKLVKLSCTSISYAAWCSHPLWMHSGSLSLVTQFWYCPQSRQWADVPSLRVNLVHSKGESGSETESIWRVRPLQDEKKWILEQSCLKPWRIKISPLIKLQSSYIKAWSELHQVSRHGQQLHVPHLLWLVCLLICSVFGLLPPWNPCEQYLACIKCGEELSTLKKIESLRPKLKTHFFSLIS